MSIHGAKADGICRAEIAADSIYCYSWILERYYQQWHACPKGFDLELWQLSINEISRWLGEEPPDCSLPELNERYANF